MNRRDLIARGAALASIAAGAPAAAAPDALPTLGSALALPAVDLTAGASSRGPGNRSSSQGSWCPFCALQSPHMEKLWQAGQGRGLQMLALSIDKKPEEATAYLAQRGYTFPAGWFTPAVARLLRKPGGLPVTVVRGRDGRVVMAEAGQLFPEDIEQIAQWL
jgi:hypothetical protein